MQADGGQLKDIVTRIARARTRFGKMRHLWNDKNLHYNLRLRLYKSSVCSIMVYGSEAWKLNEQAVRKLNGANAQMMSIISGKTPHQEASPKWRSFDIVRWIRARRLAWLGHAYLTTWTRTKNQPSRLRDVQRQIRGRPPHGCPTTQLMATPVHTSL